MGDKVLKEEVEIIKKRGIYYQLDSSGNVISYESWKGNAVAFCYDWIMDRILLPQKLAADNQRHYYIMKEMLSEVHDRRVLELATGSGSVVNFLSSDNYYIGTDVSGSLLQQARKKLKRYFKRRTLYLMSADDLGFRDAVFDYCLCVLSMNFFPDQKKSIAEMKRVLTNGGIVFGCVPVSNRNQKQAKIRGEIFHEDTIREMFESAGFRYEPVDQKNGAILYFSARKEG